MFLIGKASVLNYNHSYPVIIYAVRPVTHEKTFSCLPPLYTFSHLFEIRCAQTTSNITYMCVRSNIAQALNLKMLCVALPQDAYTRVEESVHLVYHLMSFSMDWVGQC